MAESFSFLGDGDGVADGGGAGILGDVVYECEYGAVWGGVYWRVYSFSAALPAVGCG